MVRNTFFLLFFAIFLQADPLMNKISSLMDKDSFEKKQKLIEIIFKDRENFYQNNKVDNLKVIKKLKEMGLLDLFLEKPSKIYIEFYSNKGPTLSLRLLSESLKSIGYSYIMTQKALYNKDGFYWKVYITTRQAVDPISLSNQFDRRGIKLLDISRIDKYNWRYDISATNAKVITKDIEFDTNVKLTKPLSEYWLNIENGKSIDLKPSNLDSWYPKIFFLDADLNPIHTVIKDQKTYKLSLEIPKNSRYMIISDIYTLANIKRGLDILVSSY